MKQLVALLVFPFLVISACGSSSGDSAPTVNESTVTAPSPSVEATPTPASISTKTACDLLFGNTVYMARATDWVTGDESISTGEAQKIQDDVDEIRDIATRVQGQLEANLVTWSDEVQRLLDDALGGDEGGSFDTTTFKASGIEIANICRDSL